MQTNQQDTDNDQKPVTDILTTKYPIAMSLYMLTICCQDT